MMRRTLHWHRSCRSGSVVARLLSGGEAGSYALRGTAPLVSSLATRGGNGSLSARANVVGGKSWCRHFAATPEAAPVPPVAGKAAADQMDKLTKQASAKFDSECFPEALALYQKLLQLRTEALGADHPDVGEAHHLVGETLWALDRFKEAESELSQSLAIMRKHLGPKHKAVGTVLKNIAECRQAWISDLEDTPRSKPKVQKLLLEVLSLVSEAAEIAKAHAVGEKDPEYLDTLYTLGEVYIQLDRFAEALPCFEVNLPRFIESEGGHSMDTLICLRNLAYCYRAVGERDKWEKAEVEIAEIEGHWKTETSSLMADADAMRNTMKAMGLEKQLAEFNAVHEEIAEKDARPKRKPSATKKKPDRI